MNNLKLMYLILWENQRTKILINSYLCILADSAKIHK